MAVKLKYNARIYKGSTSDLSSSEKVFEDNSIIIDTDANKLKICNGKDTYSDLPEFSGGEEGPQGPQGTDGTSFTEADFKNSLPTADPEDDGALWNDGGTIKISNGPV